MNQSLNTITESIIGCAYEGSKLIRSYAAKGSHNNAPAFMILHVLHGEHS